MNEPIIQFVDVHKSFTGANGSVHEVLKGVSFNIPPGRTTVIGGGSGQGKSVALKLILGLLQPDSGSIIVDGRDIAAMKARELNEVRADFGVLFQGVALFDSMTVFENVALPLREKTKLPAAEIRARVMESLAQFGLTGHEDKFPAQLSGGMQKRVGLARALQLQPRIMLFDEPTTGLDPARSLEIYRLFHKMQREMQYTSVIVSHDVPKIFNLADQVVVMHEGKAKVFSSSEEIQWSTDPVIQDFVQMTMGHIYQSRLERE
ncbi:MAG: ATP-binding cassette domain-containing protein [Deltaproteobacteria bacterium]|jgi:phospholipid/cholesterol/gamma-HCH transport system ATP-binding protein|nr:ATP-binding cassette domain-containing protein [Deltaproteobacteria bacterium]